MCASLCVCVRVQPPNELEDINLLLPCYVCFSARLHAAAKNVTDAM